MPSCAGKSYTVRAEDGTCSVGPGMVISVTGRWHVGEVILDAWDTAVLFDAVRAVAISDDAVLGVIRPHNRAVRGATVQHEKPWGLEVEALPHFGQLKIIYVRHGERTSLQYHREKDEVLVPIARNGSGHIDVGGDEVRIPIHLHPSTDHRAVGKIVMVEGSTHHPDDVVRLEDDYDREEDLPPHDITYP